MSDVEKIEGDAGNFTVTVKERPRYVDMDKCIACGVCATKCPRKVDDKYNQNLNKRKAIYVQYAQAVPLKYVIDEANCIYFEKGKCRACEKFCPADAIDFSQKEKTYQLEVGSVILSPGYQPYDPVPSNAYGYNDFANVITSMEFERILSASGPFEGHMVRPLDGKNVEKIAWLQCVGSRDTHADSHDYCSGICCMYSIKEAVIAKEHADKQLDTAIFYMDMRTHGKEFDKYYNRAKDEKGVRFIRSRIHSLAEIRDGSKDLKLIYVDEEGNMQSEIFDLVVLSVGITISKDVSSMAANLGIELDKDGFAAASCFSPVATSRPGIFVCGAFGGPKDIPQSVMEASAASSASAALLCDARNTLIQEKVYPDEEPIDNDNLRIGVFVCHCGINIGSIVDVPDVRDYAGTLPGVVYTADNMFSCSQDTQELIRDTVKKEKLNRVVVAACSPRTHEPLFQETIQAAGLNRYLLEFTNIRDQDAWVHQDKPKEATQKAKDLVRMAVSKVTFSEPLAKLRMPMNKAGVVVGGGIAGMNAALNMAEQGFQTYLIEQKQELGGQGLNIDKTWQDEDVKEYIKNLKLSLQNNKKIEILLNARLIEVSGFVGNFKSIVQIDGSQRELEHGVAVLASGAKPYKPKEYLYGQSDRVTRWHELLDNFNKDPEKLEQAKAVAFIQCVGSREPERPYCSKICCTSSVQQAISLKTRKPDLDVYILYRDLRTYGQREVLYTKARKLGVLFIRYSLEEKPKVKKCMVDGKEKIEILIKDHILGTDLEIKVDYLNLATAIIAEGQDQLSRLFKVPLNEDGFFMEAHMKLRPVDCSTDGVFICGLSHYPKPVEESIAQAQAAAERAANMLAMEYVEVEPIISVVNQDKCIGCGLCETICPYGAIHVVQVPGEGFKAENISALCKGCGVCAAACPQQAIDMQHFRDHQIIAAINAGGKNAMEEKKQIIAAKKPGRTSISGFQVSDDYYYHAGHSWVKMEKGGRVKIGIDDFLLKILGPMEEFELPKEGAALRKNTTGLVLKRNGHKAMIQVPITGKVFSINHKVLNNPELLYDDPYKEGWLFALEPLALKRDLKELFFKEQSYQWLEEENKKLLDLLGPEFEKLAATDDKAVFDICDNFPEIGWEKLVNTFFSPKR